MKPVKIILFLCTALSLWSCKKDYLDLNPVNNYTYYNFPQNELQAEQATVACYRQLIPIYSGYMWVFGEMLSDNTSFRFNPSDRGGLETEKLDEFLGNATEGTIGNTYRDFYEGITRSHYVLESLPNIAYSSDSVKNIRVGEAKFFRAFHYFNLVRLYGDVPIVKNVILQPDANTAALYPRKPVLQVYNEMIIPDALDAIAKLPTTVPLTQKGRLTKAAAYMLLGKAYLTLGRYADALTNFDAVTGFTLNPIYAANFSPATKNGVESIFEIQVNPIPSNSGGYSFGFGPQWAPWGTANAFWSSSNSRGGLNQPTLDLFNSYEFADSLRRKATIASTGTGATLILGMKKFMNPNAVNNAINDAQWPVYRFAETLLSRAECLNETTTFPNATAFTLLNQVRTRAGLASKTQGNANPALAVNSQAEFRLAIEKERRAEFAGEAHRWFDLLRTNRMLPVMTAHGIAEKVLKPTTIGIGAYDNIKSLIGIPSREREQFGYSQNPGW
jgi:starch-binding outer membrane protein, SusD/RagB family